MKNQYIINNKNVNIKNYIKKYDDNLQITNELNTNLNALKFVICKNEVENFIYNSNKTIDVNNNLLTSTTLIDNKIGCNITKNSFELESYYDKTPSKIVRLNSNVNNEQCDIGINQVSGYSFDCKNNLQLNDMLHTIIKNNFNETDNFIPLNLSRLLNPFVADERENKPYVNLIDGKVEILFSSEIPLLFNTFSIEMSNHMMSQNAEVAIKNNEIDLHKKLINSNLSQHPMREVSLNVDVLGFNETFISQKTLKSINIPLNENDCFWFKNRYYYYKHYYKIKGYNLNFINNEKFKKYKIVLNYKNLCNLHLINLTYTPKIYKYEPDFSDYMSKINVENIYTKNIKNVVYKYFIQKKPVEIEKLIKNLKIFNDNGITKYSCYLNPLYKQSFKYGNLITGMIVNIVSYDINNYDSTNDTTILESIHLDINDIEDLIEQQFTNYKMSDMTTIETYNIEFEILYDIDRYEQLFKVNNIETIKVKEFINNYDFNLKYANKSIVINKQPKTLICYKSVEQGLEDQELNIKKKCVNTINVPTNIKNINISMENCGYNFYFVKYCSKFDCGTNLLTQLGLLEVSQCDGTQILKKDYTDGTNLLELKIILESDIITSLNRDTYPEHLDYTNAFELEYNRSLDINNQKIVNTVNVSLLPIIILPETKYLIIKLLLKPKLNDFYVNAYNISNNELYKTITIDYDVYLQKTETIVNNQNEFDSILNNKDVAFYHFEKEVEL